MPDYQEAVATILDGNDKPVSPAVPFVARLLRDGVLTNVYPLAFPYTTGPAVTLRVVDIDGHESRMPLG